MEEQPQRRVIVGRDGHVRGQGAGADLDRVLAEPFEQLVCIHGEEVGAGGRGGPDHPAAVTVTAVSVPGEQRLPVRTVEPRRRVVEFVGGQIDERVRINKDTKQVLRLEFKRC